MRILLSQSTNVAKGESYNLTVRVNTDGNYIAHAFVWFDWNGDGDFNDAGESIDVGSRTNSTDGATNLSPVSITIPASANFGTTRMRVSAKYNADPTSCETNFDGEVEDYSINIISPPNETIADGIWNDNATWLYDIPQATQDVILNHNVTVTTNETINIVVVNNSTNESGELKINPGKSLIVNGDLTITGTNTNGILMVSSSTQGSSLIVEAGAATGIGKYSRITAVAFLLMVAQTI